jgi:hypothetical protein
MDKNVDVDFQNQTIDNVLEDLLSDENIEYKKANNNILLRKSSEYVEVKNDNYKSTIHLRGKVNTDVESMGSLAYATVMVKNSAIGTYTDENGEFDLEIPGDYKQSIIKVSYLGYQDAEYELSELTDAYVLLQMNNQAVSIEEVIIKNRKKPIRIMNSDNSISLNSTQIKSNISGVMGNDINRSIQLLPGITAHDDDCSDIKIRGRNSDETLLILDGMPIYNTDHYFGIFSGVNAAHIDSVNIYKNNYPIQYGEKTAGVIEFLSDDKIPLKAESEIGIDLLTLSGATRVPLGINSALQITGRTTLFGVNNNNFNVISDMNDDLVMVSNFGNRVDGRQSDPDFKFYDINGKYNYNNEDNLSIELNLYRSQDQFTNQNSIVIEDNRRDKLTLTLDEDRQWMTTATSVIMKKALTNNIKLNARAYYTNYSSTNNEDINIGKDIDQNGGPPNPQNQESTELGAIHNNDLTDYGIDAYAEINAGHHGFVLGAVTAQQNVSYLFEENTERKLFGEANYNSLGAYTSYTFSPSNKFKANAGLRTMYFTDLNDLFYSPRVQLRYKLSDRVALKGSYNYVQQIIRQLYYEYRSEPLDLWVAAGQNDIPVLSSHNFMLGTSLSLGAITIDIEAYQKIIDGTIEYAVTDPTNNNNNPSKGEDYNIYFGEGRVQGIDLIASFGHKKYDSYISYTLSRSQERYREINRNRFYASENDRRHQLKWVNTYRPVDI